MFAKIKTMLGINPAADFVALIQQGAMIVDVRSKGEFSGGHIKGAINIPLDELNNASNQLKDKNKIIITCCASGMRSASGKNILSAKGYTHVYNGGGWRGLQEKISK
jgi:rhodanese-related sulfurtransferase